MIDLRRLRVNPALSGILAWGGGARARETHGWRGPFSRFMLMGGPADV
ncbi:hypothetical protein NKW54_09995 [Acetobacter cerevisiae]|uniref:Uncharacterized protein n=1 Tax=Acetobacter cerevisiae TaxID=178900 RepID=A0ABT1ESB2_9PROT|nr:hypothetical protein [Acetobacter cerevisiae]MCP1246272.1 hypothetical protein [Acetobacter cerevisiae]MCP1255786.1 hypothetical protein [Acetobacter cerevisiae]